MEEFIKSILLDHWPWFAVSAILMIVGQVLSKSVFTRERAYQKRVGAKGYLIKSFFWWGRELLAIHPIMLGALIGAVWPDPEGVDWSVQASMAYFGSAGVAANFAWIVIKSRAKQQGIDLQLPGQSESPKP